MSKTLDDRQHSEPLTDEQRALARHQNDDTEGRTTNPLEEFFRFWTRLQEAAPERAAAYAEVQEIIVAPETPRPPTRRRRTRRTVTP